MKAFHVTAHAGVIVVPGERYEAEDSGPLRIYSGNACPIATFATGAWLFVIEVDAAVREMGDV